MSATPAPAAPPGESDAAHLGASPGLDGQALREILGLCALISGTPHAALSLPGGTIIWSRSSGESAIFAGPGLSPFDEYTSRCTGPFEVPHVALDKRFAAANLAIRGHAVAFYAGTRVVSVDGQALGTLAVLDIVPRRLNPEQLAALPALARQVATLARCEALILAHGLVESAPVAIYHTDALGRITYTNPEYRRILSLGPGDCLDDWPKGVHPDDRTRMQASWANYCGNPRPVTFEWRSAPRDGASRVLTEHVVAAKGIAGFVGTITDITERVEARASLRRTEAFFKNTFEQAPVGIIYADRDGKVLRGNQAFCDLLGFDSRQIEMLSLAEFTHESDVAQNAAEFERLWRGEIVVVDTEKRYLRKDRSAVWVRVTSALLRDAEGAPACAVEFLRDISARKDLAAALLQNQLLFKAVIADVPFAIRACDMEGRLFLHNPAAAELFAIGAADDARAKAQTPDPLAVELLLGDGKTPVPREQWPLACALRGESVTNAEYVIKRPGEASRTTLSSARRLAGENGECLGAVAVTQDITHKKRLERELAQAQKLESIGQLAAGIAHEINTPTQFVGDNIRFLQESFGEILGLLGDLNALTADAAGGAGAVASIAAALGRSDMAYLQDEIPKAILQSLEGVGRIAKIVAAMKEFSHPGTDRTPLDLNRAIASTITVASNEWKYVANVKTELDPRLPLVPVMPGAFNQVILNMIVNAAHAIGAAAPAGTSSKGTITVTTRRAGDWVEIGITDTGCGMPAETIPRIFDPFFTTKPVGKGTGQGLAIAHDVVVTKHGGSIAVESEQGVGTTFTLRLPLETTAPVAADAA